MSKIWLCDHLFYSELAPVINIDTLSFMFMRDVWAIMHLLAINNYTVHSSKQVA